MNVNKEAVLTAIESYLIERFERLARASDTARSEATSEDNQAESKYDTRSTEAGYLANGQALEAESAAIDLRNYRRLFEALDEGHDTVRRGSLVRMKLGAAETLLFIGLESAGFDVEVGAEEVTVISTESPLAKQLLGLSAGGPIGRPVGRVLEVM